MTLPLKALVFALAAAGSALGAAYGSAHLIREQALARGHQQPTPDSWAEETTPTSPTLVAAGRRRYLDNCAHCHGVDVTGDEGPDLHQLQVSDRYIANTVRRGIPHEMPAFSKKLSADDVTALTAYLRSLNKP